MSYPETYSRVGMGFGYSYAPRALLSHDPTPTNINPSIARKFTHRAFESADGILTLHAVKSSLGPLPGVHTVLLEGVVHPAVLLIPKRAHYQSDPLALSRFMDLEEDFASLLCSEAVSKSWVCPVDHCFQTGYSEPWDIAIRYIGHYSRHGAREVLIETSPEDALGLYGVFDLIRHDALHVFTV